MDATVTVPKACTTPETAPELGRLFLSLAATSALADFCFWKDIPGLSVGLFAIGMAGIILLNRPRMRWTLRVVGMEALICGAAVESAIDLCFSNVLVLLTLTLALAGETYYDALRGGWSRSSEVVWTMSKTPARWIWLMVEVASKARLNGPMPSGSVRKAARIMWIVVPGLVVTLIFAVILGAGNALFAKFVHDSTAAIDNWVLRLHINFWRCSFWVFIAGVALPILWPSPPPKTERIWTREMPRLPEFTTSRTARLQSAVMLGLLNVLFCCVNTIDAVYLWAGQKLPLGVNASEFVHQGVFSLIIAVLFSAILLAGMFQQTGSVSGWMPLRLLGLRWIGQNLVLLAGVFLRVKLYVDAYDLTVTRVNLAFFLVLVATGFVLLAIHIWRQRPLGRLLHANMLAAFCLFYTVQFLDTKAFVAGYNVDLLEEAGHTRELDLSYLESLGPPAFEALERAAQSEPAGIGENVAAYIKTSREKAREQLDHTPWTSWQLREMRCQRKLFARTQP
jgi:hypothetical protein